MNTYIWYVAKRVKPFMIINFFKGYYYFYKSKKKKKKTIILLDCENQIWDLFNFGVRNGN